MEPILGQFGSVFVCTEPIQARQIRASNCDGPKPTFETCCAWAWTCECYCRCRDRPSCLQIVLGHNAKPKKIDSFLIQEFFDQNGSRFGKDCKCLKTDYGNGRKRKLKNHVAFMPSSSFVSLGLTQKLKCQTTSFCSWHILSQCKQNVEFTLAAGCIEKFSSLQITGASQPRSADHFILSIWSVKCLPNPKSSTGGLFLSSFGWAGSIFKSSLKCK